MILFYQLMHNVLFDWFNVLKSIIYILRLTNFYFFFKIFEMLQKMKFCIKLWTLIVSNILFLFLSGLNFLSILLIFVAFVWLCGRLILILCNPILLIQWLSKWKFQVDFLCLCSKCLWVLFSRHTRSSLYLFVCVYVCVYIYIILFSPFFRQYFVDEDDTIIQKVNFCAFQLFEIWIDLILSKFWWKIWLNWSEVLQKLIGVNMLVLIIYRLLCTRIVHEGYIFGELDHAKGYCTFGL